MRDLSGFVETRQQLLSLKPNHHMNWIGFAVAHHLNFDSSKAVEVLEAYEGTLEDDYPPENERYEHNEMLLYKMTTAISIEDVRREVKILKALSGHSNLVKFYDASEDALNVYIIMDTLTLYMVAGHSRHKLNQELHSARSSFEQARFNLVTSLSHVEATKRYEFLEAVSATMDSHLRYFKQGYELLHQMEPYIN
uniref:BAR domain-containing protein n=1 Tax=Zea mays TaxID=4577 RepID=A0A804NNI1_MAIZE